MVRDSLMQIEQDLQLTGGPTLHIVFVSGNLVALNPSNEQWFKICITLVMCISFIEGT